MVLSVLLPTILGKGVRHCHPAVAPWVTRHKTILSITSSVVLISIVWQTLSGARERLFEQSAGSVAIIVAAAVLLHCVYLVCNHLVMRCAGGVKWGGGECDSYTQTNKHTQVDKHAPP